MSIYKNLEKIARLDPMPRHTISEASIPYGDRKARYKKFINRRAKRKLPGNNDYVVEGMVPLGVVGGLMGAAVGGHRGGLTGGAVGVAAGGLLGAGLGAVMGRAAAHNEQSAIGSARRVVKGGNYDKALQDEITAYRRYKEEQARSEKEWDRLEDRTRHAQTQRKLNSIERRQMGQNSYSIKRY
jgi:hypothetical protein